MHTAVGEGRGAGWVSPWSDPREAALMTGTSPEAVFCAASGFATSSLAVGLQANDFTFLSGSSLKGWPYRTSKFSLTVISKG